MRHTQDTEQAIVSAFLDQLEAASDQSLRGESNRSSLLAVGGRAFSISVGSYSEPCVREPLRPWVTRIYVYPVNASDEDEFRELGIESLREARVNARLEFSIVPDELTLLSNWMAEWFNAHAVEADSCPQIPIRLAGEGESFFPQLKEGEIPSAGHHSGRARKAFDSNDGNWRSIDYLWSDRANVIYQQWEEELEERRLAEFGIVAIDESRLDTCDEYSSEQLRLYQQLLSVIPLSLKEEVRYYGKKIGFTEILADWLTCMLHRCFSLARSVPISVNTHNELAAMLAVRALMECASCVTYLREKLIKHYKEDSLSLQEITQLAMKLRFGTRRPDPDLTEKEREWSAAVNVLTTLKSLRRYYGENYSSRDPVDVDTWYGILSEFCHPNHSGISSGEGMDMEQRITRHARRPKIRSHAFGVIAEPAFFSLYLFCLAHNDCWDILESNEARLPATHPTGDPRVSI